jgi:hypothetical protein
MSLRDHPSNRTWFLLCLEPVVPYTGRQVVLNLLEKRYTEFCIRQTAEGNADECGFLFKYILQEVVLSW